MNALHVADAWADHVLNSAGAEKLRAIRAVMAGPGRVILVGGAVRDAYYGRPIKDLDFMVEHKYAEDTFRAIYAALGLTLRPCLGSAPHEYEADIDSNLVSVYEDYWKSVNVLLVRNVVGRISEFPDSLSKVWTTGSAVYASEDFLATKATGQIKTYDRFTEERRERLSAKYPNFTFIKG